MPSKLQFYSEFADRTARQITGSYRAWTSFLATAARLYKYPYSAIQRHLEFNAADILSGWGV